MRYVVPAGDTELMITFRGGDSFFVSQSPEGNVYLFIEENDDEEEDPLNQLEHAHFKLFESGEAIERGVYIGSVGDGKNHRHMYWVNAYEGVRDDPTAGHVRVSVEVPEVQASGSSDASPST